MAELYRHFDVNGQLLYVGISSFSITRLQDHKLRAPWFKQVRTVTIHHFSTRAEAAEAEAVAIVKERPLHNTAKWAVKIRDELFTSKTAAMEAHGVTQSNVSYRVRTGCSFEEAVDYVKTHLKRTGGVAVCVQGVHYRSVRAAAKAFGVSPDRVHQQMKRRAETAEQAIQAVIARDRVVGGVQSFADFLKIFEK